MADGGAYPEETRNQWDAILGRYDAIVGSESSDGPRKEIIHNVHSKLHYPGNCTIDHWGPRNCPAVITIGPTLKATTHNP